MSWDDPYAAARRAHIDAVRRALRRHRGDCAASHLSAAVVRRFATYASPSAVHLTRPDGSRRTRGRTHVSVADLAPGDVGLVDDIRVTSPARTIADCARELPFLAGLVTADSALHCGLAPAALQQQLDCMSQWPGIRAARLVARWADPRVESPLESVIRGRCILLDLPVPEPQVWLIGADGRDYPTDLYWKQHRLIGEADGKVKYADAEAIWAEKQRRDALEERHTMIRWTWRQAHAPDDVFRARLLEAFARGDRLLQLLGAPTPCANEG